MLLSSTVTWVRRSEFGAAFILGEAALGAFLVLGFTLHNIIEGVAIMYFTAFMVKF